MISRHDGGSLWELLVGSEFKPTSWIELICDLSSSRDRITVDQHENQNEKQSIEQNIDMSDSSNNPGYMMASQVDDEVAKYRTLQESIQQQRSDLQLLTNQSIENELVLSELQLVKADESSSTTKVYKMVGPTLLKQDLEEAKETVQKRIEFIQVCVLLSR
jgi:chaperonin cofactor prefoldin